MTPFPAAHAARKPARRSRQASPSDGTVVRVPSGSLLLQLGLGLGPVRSAREQIDPFTVPSSSRGRERERMGEYDRKSSALCLVPEPGAREDVCGQNSLGPSRVLQGDVLCPEDNYFLAAPILRLTCKLEHSALCSVAHVQTFVAFRSCLDPNDVHMQPHLGKFWHRFVLCEPPPFYTQKPWPPRATPVQPGPEKNAASLEGASGFESFPGAPAPRLWIMKNPCTTFALFPLSHPADRCPHAIS